MKGACLILAFLALGHTDDTAGFELSTHAFITRDAYDRLLRESPSTLDRLGVLTFIPDSPIESMLGTQYLVPSQGGLWPRVAKSFEDRIIKLFGIVPSSLQGWIMRGAIREDDGQWPAQSNPQDDPYGETNRFLNHFLDPITGAPLTAVPLTQTAANWAIGTTSGFQDENVKDPLRRNHFTVADARETLFRALTLKRLQGGQLVDESQSLANAAARQARRKAYWATTFRALGDVLHLNQDMAQPQHTRNDPHSGAYLVNLGHSSFIENYFEARALAVDAFEVGLWFKNAVRITPRPLPPQLCGEGKCIDYPTPSQFTRYADFWSKAPARSGLADYSNGGFFSAGTNLGKNIYVSPSNSAQDYQILAISPTNWDGSPQGDTSPVYLYYGLAADLLNPPFSSQPVPLTSFSVWDDFMVSSNNNPKYHLIRENYDAQADLLIPRAIAYSAGLLRFFFRGEMEISAPAEGVYAVIDTSTPVCKDTCGFNKVKLKVKNMTPNENMGPGMLLAVVKFHRNACYVSDLSGDPGAPGFVGDTCRVKEEEIVVSDPVNGFSLATNAEQTVSFTFPPSARIPINATDVSLQVVFRGPLGTEIDAVAVTTKNISETNYFAVQNNTDYRYNSTTDTFAAVDSTAFSVFSTLSIKFGSSAPTVATMPIMLARTFGQIAFLTDTGVRPVIADLTPLGLSIGHPLTWDLRTATEFYLPAGGSGYNATRRVSRMRGLYRESVWAIAQGDQYAFDACASNPAKEACVENTLTPLTQQSAVPWSITF